jgi:hypothetical protein
MQKWRHMCKVAGSDGGEGFRCGLLTEYQGVGTILQVLCSSKLAPAFHTPRCDHFYTLKVGAMTVVEKPLSQEK